MTIAEIQSLKERNPITPIVERYTKLKRNGTGLRGRCPLHEGEGLSLQVYEHTQSYHCFACGGDGDVITFMQAIAGLDFQRALESLDKSALPEAPQKTVQIETAPLDIEPGWKKQVASTSKTDIEEHAKSLGVDTFALQLLGIAWSQKQHSFLYPQRNDVGQIIGLRFRNKLGHKWSLSGGRSGLFLPIGLAVEPVVAIGEGPTDTAALLSMGFYAIGRPDALSGTKYMLDFLNRNNVKRVIICTDRDPNNVGLAGAWKLHEQLSMPSRIFMPKLKDIREEYREGLTKADILQEIKKRNG